MKQLLRFLKGYEIQAICAPLFKMLEASFELVVPLVTAKIIDVGIAGADIPYILRMCLVLIGMGVVGMSFSLTAQWFSAFSAVGFATRMKSELFAHIQGLDYTVQDTQGTSTLITRMTSDANQVQNGVNLTLRLLLRSPFVVFGAMLMAFTIDVRGALVFAVTIPVLCVVVFGLMIVGKPLYKKVQQYLDGLLGITRENLTGVRVVRAFNLQTTESTRFEEQNQRLETMQQVAGKISSLMNPITYVLINLATLWLLYSGAVQVNTGVLRMGQVVALLNYMGQILVELIKMANLTVTITKALASADRIQKVFELTPTLADGTHTAGGGAQAPAVQFENVSLRYAGAGDESLAGISFTVQPGQTMGIIGSTGSGKTSLVHLIARFYEATEGAVLVHGRNVKEWNLEALRALVGMVPQKATLFHGTIRENLLWGNPDATDDQLWQALADAQATEVVRGKKNGLDEMVQQNATNFSGGQRQRLTIARALVRRPEILILDDSASALDLATERALRNALQALPWHPTVFIVSQRAASLLQADQILVLEEGEAAGLGTSAQLRESCDIYQEIYVSQFGQTEEMQ